VWQLEESVPEELCAHVPIFQMMSIVNPAGRVPQTNLLSMTSSRSSRSAPSGSAYNEVSRRSHQTQGQEGSYGGSAFWQIL
jgi:hypothetical protein